MKDFLERLAALSGEELLDTARQRRRHAARCDWELAALVLCMERQEVHRVAGFSSMVQFAEKKLELEPQKTCELLRMARSLESLPELSVAYREGEICYSKIREICRVADASSDARWAAFARSHTCEEVQQAVVRRPRARSADPPPSRNPQDLTLDLKTDETGDAGTADVPPSSANVAAATKPAANDAGSNENPLAQPPEAKPTADPSQLSSYGKSLAQAPEPKPAEERSGPDVRPPSPLPPNDRLVEVRLTFKADEYKVFETAVTQMRAAMPGRAGQAAVVVEMCRRLLAGQEGSGSVRSLLMLHVDGNTQAAWWDTARGPVPASPEALNQALQDAAVAIVAEDAGRTSEDSSARLGESSGPTESSRLTEPAVKPSSEQPGIDRELQLRFFGAPRKPGSRPALTVALLLALFVRSLGRCEHCRGLGPFHVDHIKPWSESLLHVLDNFSCSASGVIISRQPASWRTVRPGGRPAAGPMRDAGPPGHPCLQVHSFPVLNCPSLERHRERHGASVDVADNGEMLFKPDHPEEPHNIVLSSSFDRLWFIFLGYGSPRCSQVFQRG